MAYGFKSGGRKKGSLNKVTADMKATIAALGETPLEYMIRVMRDPSLDAHRRDEMAKAAAPYLHSRLATIQQSIEAHEVQHVISDSPVTADDWVANYCSGRSTKTPITH
jgi:hypothetical protein